MKKNILKVVVLASMAGTLLVADMADLPFDLGLVSDAEAVAGRQRRTRRRGVAVGYAAGSASASAAAASQQQAATADQQAATAQQQSATAQQQSATAQQQSATAPEGLVPALPNGCVTAGDLFQCGGTYYKAYLSGNQVLYGVVPPPSGQ